VNTGGNSYINIFVAYKASETASVGASTTITLTATLGYGGSLSSSNQTLIFTQTVNVINVTTETNVTLNVTTFLVSQLELF
jgi:hypothetical protein